jgi:hypothetical protein
MNDFMRKIFQLVFTCFLLLSLFIMPLKAETKTQIKTQQRSKQLAFKGVELYSWQDSQSQAWHFSLLPGTNRNKSLAEIQNKDTVINDVRLLKKQLAKLAVGESVFWSTPYPALAMPADQIKHDISAYAAKQQIKLSLLNNANRAQINMLHGKYKSKDEPLGVLVFNKNGQFGYANPSKIDFFSADNLPNKNIGQYKVEANNMILFSFTESLQGFLPSKMFVENSGKTVILEREKANGAEWPKTAVYELQP